MFLFTLIFSALCLAEDLVLEGAAELQHHDVSSGTYRCIIPRVRPRFASYCSSSSKSCSRYCNREQCRCEIPCARPGCPSASSSSSSSCSSSSSSCSSTEICYACNQELTYSFDAPSQIKYISVSLSSKCRPSRHGHPNRHCKFMLFDDGKPIYSSAKPWGPIKMGNGLHDVSMRIWARETVRVSVSSVRPDCPQASTGICFSFEGHAKVCFCSPPMYAISLYHK